MSLPYRWKKALEKGFVNGLYQFFATMVGIFGYGQVTGLQIMINEAFYPAVIVSLMTAGLAFSKTLKECIEEELAYKQNINTLNIHKAKKPTWIKVLDKILLF